MSDRCTPSVDPSDLGEETIWPIARPLLDSYPLYIDGRWVEPESGRYDDISSGHGGDDRPSPGCRCSPTSTPRFQRRGGRSTPGRGPTQRLRSEARCLNQLGNALMQHADEFFALSQAEWGCIANERLIQIDGPAFMAMNAG